LVFGARIGSGGVVIKTDFNFNLIWQSALYPDSIYGFKALEPYGDGWVGVTFDDFVRLSATGDTIWSYSEPLPGHTLLDTAISSNGLVYTLAWEMSGFALLTYDCINESMTCIMDSFPKYGYAQHHQSIVFLPDGNLVVLCMSTATDILHCFDPSGNLLWSRSYYTYPNRYFGLGSKNFLVTPDSSIIFCMYDSGSQIFLYKTDSIGYVSSDDPLAPVAETCFLTCYPNPATRNLRIKYSLPTKIGSATLEIFNSRGQKVYTRKILDKFNEVDLELFKEVGITTSGIYVVRIRSNQSTLASFRCAVIK
jgi:hypothetical protein